MSSPQPSGSRRRLLLVTGMHGSGTSATARGLGLLGGHLPRGTESAGLCEPPRIGRIHQELLQAVGSSWDDTRPIPEEWFESAAARAFRDRLASAFLEEYGEADLAIVKDRHLGRLVPLWLRVAEALSAEPLFVIPFRNPVAVAGSLRQRDGFPLHKSLVLWLQHVVLAEHGSRGHRRAFVAHEGLVANPSQALARAANELGVAWPRPVAEATAGILNVLLEPPRPDHDEWDVERNDVPPLVLEAYDLLAGLEASPGPSDLARFDRIRQAYLEADRLLGPLVGTTNVSEIKDEVAGLADLLHALAAQKGAQAAPLVATKNRARKADAKRPSRRRQRWTSTLMLAAMALRSGTRALFDMDWYQRAYPDVPRSRPLAFLHFLRHGARENRDPHPLFDVSFYLEKNPDVRTAGVHPLVHFLRTGGAEGRDPHPLFDSSFYLEKHPDVWTSGVNPLVHYLKRGWREGRDPSPWFSTSAYLRAHPELERAGRNPLVHSLGSAPVDSLVASGLPSVGPLRLLHVTNSAPRLTLVTDSLSDGSFFGGVATALILATELARASGRSLRIVTRHAFPKVENYHSLLELHGLARPGSLELWTDHDWRRADHFRLDVSPDDVFLTTSWWTTRAVRASGYAGRVFYVLQECETMFYPHGEEHLAATRVLQDPSLLFMVNTGLLAEYFAAAGYDNIAPRAAVFEPAFPDRCYLPGPGSFAAKDRYRLFFYARPHHPRNLYYTGLQLLNEAVRSGMLDTEEVEICLAGAPLEPIKFANGYEPRRLGKLDLQGYLRLLGSVDLGVSLMYTPHPSYPPLEVVASGGIGLTNGFANKTRLDAYSRNIVCFDLTDPRDAEKSLETALGLMRDPAARRANYEQGRVHRDWSQSLKPAVAFFLEHAGG